MRLFTLIEDDDLHPQLKCIWEDPEVKIESDDPINSLVWTKQLSYLETETLMVVALNQWNVMLGVYHASSGTSESCDVNMREIATFLLLIGAKRFYTVHNHPSCFEAKQSEADIENGNWIEFIGDMIGLEHLDDVVVARDTFVVGDKEYSWKEVM